MKRLRAGFILAFVLVLIFSATGVTGTSSAASSAPESIVMTGSHCLAKGLSIHLKSAVRPAQASQEVKWESSDPSIAKVSKKGKVTGLENGNVTITARSVENPSVRKKWNITVYSRPVKKIKLSASAKTLYLDVRKTVQVVADVSPADACNILTWKSSNKKIASVSKSGFITTSDLGRFVPFSVLHLTATTDCQAIPSSPSHHALYPL